MTKILSLAIVCFAAAAPSACGRAGDLIKPADYNAPPPARHKASSGTENKLRDILKKITPPPAPPVPAQPNKNQAEAEEQAQE